MLRQSFRELLEGVPDPTVTDPIHEAISRVRTGFGLPEPTTRIGKLGRKVYLELDFLVGDDQGWVLDDADRVRRELIETLARPGQLLWGGTRKLHTDPGVGHLIGPRRSDRESYSRPDRRDQQHQCRADGVNHPMGTHSRASEDSSLIAHVGASVIAEVDAEPAGTRSS